MIRNYFNTAIRNLTRHRFFSIINIAGLAMAMSICMGIIMLVADQMEYDQYNSKKDRVYRVNTLSVGSDLQTNSGAVWNSMTGMALHDELEKYSGIESIVRFRRGFGNGWISFENQDVNVPIGGYFADVGALEMFEYKLQYGDASTALRDPYSVVITRQCANKLFSEENPLGKTIKVGDLGLYIVTGVIAETENKTHIAFEALASMGSLMSLSQQGKIDANLDDWTDFWTTWTYIQLKPGVDTKDIQKNLDKIFDEKIAVQKADATRMRMFLQNLTAMTPGPFVNNPIGPSMPWILIYILSGLAGVIMITSCFNFTNLSIARSLTRAREIGVRKVNGASRKQIFGQFISEALIVSMCALIISLALLMLVSPLILQLRFAHIFRWDLAANYKVFGVFIVFAIVVGLFAGMFPAIVLSGFQPVKVLKSLNNIKLFSKMGLRKALLVSQFTIALIFILSVTVLYNQLDLFLNKNHGFDMDKHLRVKLNKTEPNAFKSELLKNSNIISVSSVSHLPASGTTWATNFRKNLTDDEFTSVRYFSVDEDYADNLNLKMIAGKFFDATKGLSNKKSIVINSRAVEAFRITYAIDAIGAQLFSKSDSSVYTIIGVIQDYNHEELFSKIAPMALKYEPKSYSLVQIKYSGNYNDAVKTTSDAWAIANPGLKADIRDMREDVMLFYNTVMGDAVDVLGFIAFLAIFISCLGLLGMATYATETRIKEVSIRKVLGSENSSLVYLLSKGFLMIILIAMVVGVPAAYFLNTLWLELLPYHVTVSFTVIGFGVGMLLLFAMITVGSQTYRATFVNPVENLKSE